VYTEIKIKCIDRLKYVIYYGNTVFLFNYNTLNRRTKNKTKGVLLSFITVRNYSNSLFGIEGSNSLSSLEVICADSMFEAEIFTL